MTVFVNFSRLNLEEALKWQKDLQHFAAHHSCDKLRAKYGEMLKELNEVIKKLEDKNGRKEG
jgi:hypothetical protein